MHLFTEFVGIQMLPMNALEPLLCGEKMTQEQLAALYRRVQTSKAARAYSSIFAFSTVFTPLQRYCLPYYLRAETAGLTHPVSQYQLLYVLAGEKPGRAAPGQGCTAGFNSAIRRQAVASDAYSRGDETRFI
jgi:hypothetical protein